MPTEPATTIADKDCTKFRNGNTADQVGGVYQYFDVSESSYAGLMSACSKGSYFDSFIKNGGYTYRQVG